jgi:hypothetical protein
MESIQTGQELVEEHPDMPRDQLIQIRSGTAAEWAAANPVLENQEPGYIEDTNVLKVGDGVSRFSELTGIAGGITVSSTLTTRQVPYVPAIPNIVNPGFEEATITGWTTFENGQFPSGLIELSTSYTHVGAQSLKITANGSNNVYGVYQNLDLRDTSHITVWAYSTSNCQIRMTADLEPEDFTYFENVGGLVYGEWTLYSYEIPNELRVKDGIIWIGILDNGGGSKIAYIDDVSYILDGTVNECNFIPDVDDYIDDEIDTHIGLPAQTTKKQVMFRQVTGELGDYGWIDDVDDYIDDEIDSHLSLPAKELTKQVPYRSTLRNLIINGTMNDGPLILAEHYFTVDSIHAIINPNHIFDIMSLVNPNHVFDNNAARNAYFIANPTELIEGVVVWSGTIYSYQRYVDSTWIEPSYDSLLAEIRDAYFVAHPTELIEGLIINFRYKFQQYTGSIWTEPENDDLLEEIRDAYFIAHPEDLLEGVTRCTVFSSVLYEKYIDSIWTEFETEDYYGGWLPVTLGTIHNYILEQDTTEMHSGTGCLKTTYNIEGWSDFLGAGIEQKNVDLTHATHISIWIKGEGAAIGKYVSEITMSYSSQQEITGEWAQYTFDIHPNYQGPSKTLSFAVGEVYANPDDEYIVYWDDCILTGGIENEIEWIEDIDTYFGLGGAAYLSVGTTTGTVAAGDDARFGGGSIDVSDIDDEIDSYLNLPARAAGKQVPYRPNQINIVPHGNMETLLVSSDHLFTLDDVDASISPVMFFDSASTRDAFFVANPGLLVEGVLVAIIDSPLNTYQKYLSSTWTDVDAYEDLIQEIMEDYYTNNPEEVYEGATRAFDWWFWIEYDIYTEGDWYERDDYSAGWYSDWAGNQYHYNLSLETSEQYNGSGCLKTTFTLDEGGDDFTGAGIIHDGIDLTYATQVKIWVKAADDAISKQIKLSSYPFESDPQTITDEWTQYSFDIPEGSRLPDRSLQFVVGETNADSDDVYTVYWDDCILYGGDLEPRLSWIPDIDTYFDEKYLSLPENPESSDGVIPVYHPGLTLIEDTDFSASPSLWSTYSYEEAGVTPNIGSLDTVAAYYENPPYRLICFTISHDGSSAPAVASHRYIFEDAIEGTITGSVGIKFYGPSSFTGLSLWIEKIGSDGNTVLGKVHVDSSVLSAGSGEYTEVTFDGINEIEGTCGGIGIRLELESTASTTMYYLEISNPTCILESETEYLPENTLMRWRGTAASDPADSQGGDHYWNTGNSKMYMHNGTSYIALT